MPTAAEIQRALQRCLAAEPPVDFALSSDASQLTTVFAEMRFERQAERELQAFKPKQLDAYTRWSA